MSSAHKRLNKLVKHLVPVHQEEVDCENCAEPSGLTILVTRPIVHEGLKLIRKAGHKIVMLNELKMNEDQLIANILQHKADGLVSMLSDPITARVVNAVKHQLKVIAQFAVGHDNIDLKACKAAGIPVSFTPGVLTDATCDQAFNLLIAACRSTAQADRYVRDGKFKRFETRLMLGPGFRDKVMGIYGFGRIGQMLASRCAGFGMKVIYFDSYRQSAELEAKLNARYVDFETLVRESDFISVHVNLTPTTRHSFTRKQFEMMKPTAVIVNTARGPVIKEDDLAWALKNGKIWAAGLDVFEFEPRINAELLKLDNVVLAPHLGSATREARGAMSRICGEAIVNFFAGKPLQFRAA